MSPKHPGYVKRAGAIVALTTAIAIAVPPSILAAEIHDAAAAGELEKLRELLDVDPELVRESDDSGDQPLHWAAARGQSAAARLLLDRGAEIDVQDHAAGTPLYWAVAANHHDLAALLLERGANTELADEYERTPLIWVARESGDLEMARLLLSKGAEIDALDRFDDSALSLAAWRGFRSLVDLLLDAGARLDLVEGMREVLLERATEHGLERLYTALVADGLSIEVEPTEYSSILHLAANGRSSLIVSDLIQRGAPVDDADMFGWTPLHHAASRGRDQVVGTLIEAGADLDPRTISGYSALNLAERRGSESVRSLLLSAGADPGARRFPELVGPYLGQGTPPATPQPFAPDIVATCMGTHGSVSISPSGEEIFWSGATSIPDSGYVRGTILHSRQVDGRWTPPRRASFAGEAQGDDVPFFSPGGLRLFFLSRRPLDGSDDSQKENIWVVERCGEGWGDPVALPAVINEMRQHWQISVAQNGNLYFASRRGDESTRGIYCAVWRDGEYQTPEFLGFGGHTPFVAADESYLITLDGPGKHEHNQIRFRTGEGSWGAPVSITETYPGVGGLCPMVSPDGRAFFFLSQRTGYNNQFWVNAGFIEKLRAAHGASAP